jgi:Domain of Unknown Function with PDB structure (DUF3864)
MGTETVQKRVIDFTRYDLPAREPDEPQREWRLMNGINQKRTRRKINLAHCNSCRTTTRV